MPSDTLVRRYRQKAAECLELAGHTVDRAEGIRLLDIASAYIRLAEHALRWAADRAPPVIAEAQRQPETSQVLATRRTEAAN